MTFVGSHHADGRVFGFALIPPSGKTLLQIERFRDAFEAVASYDQKTQRRVMTIQGSALRKPLCLSPVPDDENSKQSLRPSHYLMKSTRWASVTPIVLDRHLKTTDDAEVREIIVRACEHIGLPTPNTNRIQVGKHSALTGAAPARPLTGEPPWCRWQLPKSLKSRQMTHAVIEFDQQICGPVLLGAGRFNGLGLCRGVR